MNKTTKNLLILVVFVLASVVGGCMISSKNSIWETASPRALTEGCEAAIDTWAQQQVTQPPVFLSELRDPDSRTKGDWWTFNAAIRPAPDEFSDNRLQMRLDESRRRQIAVTNVYRQYLYGVASLDRDAIASQPQRNMREICKQDFSSGNTFDATGFFDYTNTVMLNKLAENFKVAPGNTQDTEIDEGALLAVSLVGLTCGESFMVSTKVGVADGLEGSRLCPTVHEYLKEIGAPILAPLSANSEGDS